MKFEELVLLLDAAIGEILTQSDFVSASGGTWIRCRGNELNVIQIQKHSSEPSFCVNLGVHYTFLPKAGNEVPLDCAGIEFPDCEIKLRLTSQPTVKDQWWPIIASSIGEVADLLTNRAFLVFDSYRLIGPISEMDGKCIEKGDLGLLASITKVRACLLLARMHEHLGNREKCIEAATLGVKLAGMAVGPKKALKDILKRLAQPLY